MSKERQSLFYKKELSLLNGPKNINTWILTTMLSLTLLGLGHSIGGLKYLKKRMDNPFTNWINLPVNPLKTAESNQLKDYFTKQENRKEFELDTVRGNRTDYLEVVNKSNKSQYTILSRTIDPDEKLFHEILKKSNLITRNDLNQDLNTSCWIVIKEETLERLGYDQDFSKAQFLEVLNFYKRDQFDNKLYFHLHIPILAVVKDLPDLADILISDHFSELFFSSYDESNFIRLRRNNHFQLLVDNQKALDKVLDKELFDFGYKKERVYCDEFLLNGESLQLCNIYLDSILDTDEKLIIAKKISQNKGIYQYCEYECDSDSRLYLSTENNLAFSFLSLNKVRALRQAIKEKFQFEISINQVEDKENFVLVAYLTTLLAILLFVLSLLGVIVFIVKILVSHLDRIQPNLGTFKAFGLSNQLLLNDYQNIIFLFLTGGLTRAMIITMLYLVLSKIAGLHFDVFHWSIAAAIIILFLAVRLVSYYTLKSKLNKTPGDLIYGR